MASYCGGETESHRVAHLQWMTRATNPLVVDITGHETLLLCALLKFLGARQNFSNTERCQPPIQPSAAAERSLGRI